MTKIVGLDILGPMYHYDDVQGWKPEEGAVKTLLEKIEAFGYNPQTADEEAKVEEEMLRKGETAVDIMPGFVESVIYAQLQGAVPIIISAGTPDCFEIALEAAAKDYTDRTGGFVRPQQLFPEEHRHSTVGVGSKKKAETWAEIVRERYGNRAHVVATYEDTWANLQAAVGGLGGEGYHVVAQPSGLVTVEKGIYRGTMTELLSQLKEALR
jgi:hypothetical protein